MAKATRHAKRFVVELFLPGSLKWVRSGNEKIREFFFTKEEAQAALAIYGSTTAKYRIRQK